MIATLTFCSLEMRLCVTGAQAAEEEADFGKEGELNPSPTGYHTPCSRLPRLDLTCLASHHMLRCFARGLRATLALNCQHVDHCVDGDLASVSAGGTKIWLDHAALGDMKTHA
ncbi:hypothetical protein BKA81DRAFT_349113 [Phyllosticta paracitricarpa]